MRLAPVLARDTKALEMWDRQKDRFALLARHGGNLSSAAREAGVSAERMRVIKCLVEQRMFNVIDTKADLEQELTDNYGVPKLHEHRREREELAEHVPMVSLGCDYTVLDDMMVAGVA